jgi:hypothetical protein
MPDPVISALLLQVLLIAGPAGGDVPKADAAAPAAAAEKAAKPAFTPPPGFRAKKRGKFTVYCKREEPKGTRFPSEVCYDEAGLRQREAQLQEEQVKVDQIRRIQTITIH